MEWVTDNRPLWQRALERRASDDPLPTRVAVPKGRHKPRGFAAPDPAYVRAMARKGGRAVQAAGTAHKWTSEEARAAVRARVAKRAQRKAAES